MKTKREVLEEFAKNGDCENINCKKECPYCFSDKCLDLDLRKIGAMAILRQKRKKTKFDPNKVLTCVTADKAKVGMKGYFADSLEFLKKEFAVNNIYTLYSINDESCCERFVDKTNYLSWTLFYPIDEEVEE
jgi:hypothetical protein